LHQQDSFDRIFALLQLQQKTPRSTSRAKSCSRCASALSKIDAKQNLMMHPLLSHHREACRAGETPILIDLMCTILLAARKYSCLLVCTSSPGDPLSAIKLSLCGPFGDSLCLAVSLSPCSPLPRSRRQDPRSKFWETSHEQHFCPQRYSIILVHQSGTPDPPPDILAAHRYPCFWHLHGAGTSSPSRAW
jgi:hypothetical protein